MFIRIDPHQIVVIILSFDVSLAPRQVANVTFQNWDVPCCFHNERRRTGLLEGRLVTKIVTDNLLENDRIVSLQLWKLLNFLRLRFMEFD